MYIERSAHPLENRMRTSAGGELGVETWHVHHAIVHFALFRAPSRLFEQDVEELSVAAEPTGRQVHPCAEIERQVAQ